jgi:hypothetical protein
MIIYFSATLWIVLFKGFEALPFLRPILSDLKHEAIYDIVLQIKSPDIKHFFSFIVEELVANSVMWSYFQSYFNDALIEFLYLS